MFLIPSRHYLCQVTTESPVLYPRPVSVGVSVPGVGWVAR